MCKRKVNMKQKIRSLFITLLAMLVGVGITLVYIPIIVTASAVVFTSKVRELVKELYQNLNKD